MNPPFPLRTGGQLVVDTLRANGVDRAFCVPGESYLAVLDALYDVREEIQLVVCRQEGGAAFMAEAYGKLTGRPGICMVTRGPGATNAAIGVHTAYQDSSPMILLIGQVGGDVVEREAFQEVDYRRMFGQLAKWTAQIDRPERIPELLGRAFQVAVSGRPGPVVLALPEDMLVSEAGVAPAAGWRRAQPHPGGEAMAELAERLCLARNPFVILGGGDWSASACRDMASFLERWELAAGCSFRRQDLLDNEHLSYAGEVGIVTGPDLRRRIAEADLLLVVGARLGEMTTSGYTLLEVPRPRQRIVHVHPGVDELGRVYQADLMINAGMTEFAQAAAALSPPLSRPWADWRQDLHREHLATRVPVEAPGDVNLSEIVQWLVQRLPADTILTNGAGNFSGWVQRFYSFRGYRTYLGPTSGAMGYGVPAAISAKLTYPHRAVVCFTGDGDFLMNGQELATAAQYGAAVVFVVVDNAMYGTIRMHQEREYPTRVHGTALQNPDFAALARAYGLVGEAVHATAEFAPAFERVIASRGPGLIHVKLDPEAISTRTSLAAIRAAALRRRG